MNKLMQHLQSIRLSRIVAYQVMILTIVLNWPVVGRSLHHVYDIIVRFSERSHDAFVVTALVVLALVIVSIVVEGVETLNYALVLVFSLAFGWWVMQTFPIEMMALATLTTILVSLIMFRLVAPIRLRNSQISYLSQPYMQPVAKVRASES